MRRSTIHAEETSSESVWRTLTFFRIGVSAVLLAKLVIEVPDFLNLYGPGGIMPWRISAALLDGYQPSLAIFTKIISFLGISLQGSLTLIATLYFISLLLLSFGKFGRLSAVSAYIIHFALVNSATLSAYGLDAFAHISLFYLMIFPCYKKRPHNARFASLCVWILQLHMIIVYVSSGIAKAMGPDWWDGESIWRAIMQPQFAKIDMSFVHSVPVFAQLLGLLTLVFEIGYPMFMLPKASRNLGLIAIISMHLAIGLGMGLWLFSSLMIVLNVSAYGSSVLDRLESYRQKLIHPRTDILVEVKI